MQPNGIYSDGQTAKQHPCHLVLSNEELLIYFTEQHQRLLIWSLKGIRTCQLNANKLMVTYGDFPHQSIECQGELAQTIYEFWSKGNFVKNAEGIVHKGKATIAVALTAVFLAMLAAFYFYIVPWAGEKAATLIPIEAEVELGNSIAKVYTDMSEQNDSLNQLLNDFVKELSIASNYTIETGVIISDQINAFALPGGKIFVYSAILQKMKTYEELVALLGHEITHVVNQHSLKSICRSAASGMVIATLFGDITGISSAVLSQADQFKQLNYSRELETEADDMGYELMLTNGIDPKGMVDLLKLLKEEGGKMPELMQYLSTHPDTDARIKNIEDKKTTGLTFSKNEKLESLFNALKNKLDE